MDIGGKLRRDILSFETFFVLFVFSGSFKAAPYFDWIPVDLAILFGSISGGIAIYLAVMDGRLWQPAGLRIIGIYWLFVGYASLSGIWSPSEEYYLLKLAYLGTVTAFSLGGAAFITATSRRRLRRFGAVLMVVCFAIAVETIYQFIFVGPWWELTIFGTNYLITGRVVGIGIVLGFYYLLIERPGWMKSSAAGLITIVMIGAIGFSGARGPLVTAFGTVGFLVLSGLVTGTLPRSRRAISAYVVGTLGSFGGLVALSNILQVRGIERIVALADGPGESLGTRFVYWSSTIGMFDESTIIWGYGLGSWPLYMGYSDEQIYPHNIILELLFELGLIGSALFVCLVGYAIYSTVQGWRQYEQTEYLALAALFVYMFVNALISGDFNENRYLFTILGLMVYSPTMRRTRATNHWTQIVNYLKRITERLSAG